MLFTPLMSGRANAPTSDVVSANTSNLAAAVKLKKGCKLHIFKYILDISTSLNLDYASCMGPFSVFFSVCVFLFKTSPHLFQLFRIIPQSCFALDGCKCLYPQWATIRWGPCQLKLIGWLKKFCSGNTSSAKKIKSQRTWIPASEKEHLLAIFRGSRWGV